MIAVRLFGATTVEVDGQALPSEALRGRPRQILEILALAAGAPVPKDRLADLVWEGDPPVSHHGTLESYVCVLRRSLGVCSGRASALATSAGGYRLSSEVSVDLVQFRQLAREARDASAERAVRAMLQALDLVGGDLLHSEPYAGWAERAREVFAADAVAGFTRAAGLANGIRAYDDAAALARAALGHDRLCEAAWQHLIRSHWLAGRHGEALRAYAELRAVMLDELGDEPGQESRALYQAILAEPVGVTHPAATHGELRTLLRLLRQTLEAIPGVQVPALDAGLSAEAIRVLGVR
ncbi:MAG: winged helix-turn-helix domain-containing protein [Nocardioidaceae bacterium]|nr:winged helix-turn-helix domain-containing protein [Nocardioidaceae bacterium]